MDRRRVRSDLLETFKIINMYYDLTVGTFLNLIMLEEEDIAKCPEYFLNGKQWNV